MSYNKAVLVGRLGKDAEVRYTGAGLPVANFSIATEHYGGREKGQVTMWHKIILWGKAAEALQPYLTKGQQVLVEGRIEHRQWQDKDGQTKKATEVVADQVRLLGGKRSNEAAGGGNEGHEPGYTEDDIPF